MGYRVCDARATALVCSVQSALRHARAGASGGSDPSLHPAMPAASDQRRRCAQTCGDRPPACRHGPSLGPPGAAGHPGVDIRPAEPPSTSAQSAHDGGPHRLPRVDVFLRPEGARDLQRDARPLRHRGPSGAPHPASRCDGPPGLQTPPPPPSARPPLRLPCASPAHPSHRPPTRPGDAPSAPARRPSPSHSRQ